MTASFQNASTPQVGSTIAERYRLVRVLGVGGMGTVFEAMHAVTHKRVALKLITASQVESSETTAQRFFREAQASVAIGHATIVDVLDAGELEDQSLYLVFELLDGEDFESAVTRRILDARTILEVASEVLDGLAAAHERGFIHRDIKPANIFLARDRRGRTSVKLLDFGIVKRVGSQVHEITAQHAIVGTLDYMAPEQFAGATIDERTDLWAVGAVLYRAFAGKPPNGARDGNGAVPPILAIEPGVPPDIASIIDRALSSDRNDRYVNAEDMRNAIVTCLSRAWASSFVNPFERLHLRAADLVAQDSAAHISSAPEDSTTSRSHGAARPDSAVLPSPSKSEPLLHAQVTEVGNRKAATSAVITKDLPAVDPNSVTGTSKASSLSGIITGNIEMPTGNYQRVGAEAADAGRARAAGGLGTGEDAGESGAAEEANRSRPASGSRAGESASADANRSRPASNSRADEPVAAEEANRSRAVSGSRAGEPAPAGSASRSPLVSDSRGGESAKSEDASRPVDAVSVAAENGAEEGVQPVRSAEGDAINVSRSRHEDATVGMGAVVPPRRAAAITQEFPSPIPQSEVGWTREVALSSIVAARAAAVSSVSAVEITRETPIAVVLAAAAAASEAHTPSPFANKLQAPPLMQPPRGAQREKITAEIPRPSNSSHQTLEVPLSQIVGVQAIEARASAIQPAPSLAPLSMLDQQIEDAPVELTHRKDESLFKRDLPVWVVFLVGTGVALSLAGAFWVAMI